MKEQDKIGIPKSLESERLIILMPTVDDASAICDAIAESLEELRPCMPWADAVPSLDENAEP